MRFLWTLVTAVTFLTLIGAPSAHAQNTSSTINEATIGNTSAALLPQLAAEVKKASDHGLTPVADVGASWCEPCHLVDHVLHDTSMKATMAKMYVIHLDLDIWKDSLAAMGADVNTGIPRLFKLSHAGKPVGEPWRPRDIPDSLQQKGTDEAFRLSIIDYFKNARAQFAQAK